MFLEGMMDSIIIIIIIIIIYIYLRMCYVIFIYITALDWGTRWRSWLRHCATSRKVAGSIPDGIIEIFH